MVKTTKPRSKKPKADILEAAYGEPLNLPKTPRDSLKKNTSVDNELIAAKTAHKDDLFDFQNTLIGATVLYLATFMAALSAVSQEATLVTTFLLLINGLAMVVTTYAAWQIEKKLK